MPERPLWVSSVGRSLGGVCFVALGRIKPEDRSQRPFGRTDQDVQAHQARGEVVTGLLYVDPLATDLHTALNTSAAPLNSLDADRLCPGAAALARLNAALR